MVTKSQKQYEVEQAVIANSYQGILHLCVRFGKTRIGLHMNKAFIDQTGKRVIILVPSETVKDVWTAENNNVQSILVVTASQLLSLGRTVHTELLIVDEAHRFTADEWYNLINGTLIKYTNLLMLTATLPVKARLQKLLKLVPVIYTITEKEALDNNWVSRFVEYNIPLELLDDDKFKYVRYTKEMSEMFHKYKNAYKYITIDNQPIFNDDLSFIQAVAYGNYSKQFGFISSEEMQTALIKKMLNNTEWTKEIMTKECKHFMNTMRSRHNLIIANEVKLNAVLHIFNSLLRPTICFSEHTGFSEKIADRINEVYSDTALSYNTKTPSKSLIDPHINDYYRYVTGNKAGEPKLFSRHKQLEYTIESLRIGHLKFISAVNCLNESITIPEIDCIIITSGSTNPITYEQRSGRGKTFLDDNKVAKIYNLYFDDFVLDGIEYESKDKQKLQLRQKNYGNINHIKIEDV